MPVLLRLAEIEAARSREAAGRIVLGTAWTAMKG